MKQPLFTIEAAIITDLLSHASWFREGENDYTATFANYQYIFIRTGNTITYSVFDLQDGERRIGTMYLDRKESAKLIAYAESIL